MTQNIVVIMFLSKFFNKSPTYGPNSRKDMSAIMLAQRSTISIMLSAVALAWANGTSADQGLEYRQNIPNDMRQCAPGRGPAVRVTITGIKSADGMIRTQSYRGIASDWLERGKWIYRIESPAREGSMVFCMPLPGPGIYGIAVRHDTNNNGRTEITKDGGGMSNNPSINIFNMGKPSYRKTAFEVQEGVISMQIDMKYL